jgi:hypothetical protein
LTRSGNITVDDGTEPVGTAARVVATDEKSGKTHDAWHIVLKDGREVHVALPHECARRPSHRGS